MNTQLSQRERRLIVFALWRLQAAAYNRANECAQVTGRGTAEDAARFLRDAEDAGALITKLSVDEYAGGRP